MIKSLMTTAAVMALLVPNLSHAQSASGSIQAGQTEAPTNPPARETLGVSNAQKFTVTGASDWCAKGQIQLIIGEGSNLKTADAYAGALTKWASLRLMKTCPEAKAMKAAVVDASGSLITVITGTRIGSVWNFSDVIDLDAVLAQPDAPAVKVSDATPVKPAETPAPVSSSSQPTATAGSTTNNGLSVELYRDVYARPDRYDPNTPPASSTSLGSSTVRGGGIVNISLGPIVKKVMAETPLGDFWSYTVKYSGQIKTPSYGKYLFFAAYQNMDSAYNGGERCVASLIVNSKPVVVVNKNQPAADGEIELDEGLQDVVMMMRCASISRESTPGSLANLATFKVKYQADPNPRSLRINDFLLASAE
jgi:hypothetical protein